MQPPTRSTAPALHALLEGFIDYAGVFPPAKLTLPVAVENFEKYSRSDYSWMLRWLVLPATDLAGVPPALDGKLSVLSESDETRAAVIESKGVISAERPVYCEVALDHLADLEAVKKAGLFGKIRTGGLQPAAIPATKDVAAFIAKCAELRLSFKATAGLHHPIRASYPLTYEADSPHGVMHGFLNVLVAAAFAWNGKTELLEPILEETDAKSFQFSDKLLWRGEKLDESQIRSARRDFMHSVGSCSFDEPVHELTALGLL